MNKQYNADDIKVLEGLEPVRKRPGMYIGSTDIKGLHHLLWELLDNSIDEVMAGFANKIIITLHPNNIISIEDNGRGIPVDINKNTGLSGVETVFTILHAGGKFDDSIYKTSGGLHGVGSSVVNALSDLLICQISRNSKKYEVKFANGGKIIQNLKEIGIINKTGTKILFHPDPIIFGNIKFDERIIRDRLLESSFLFNNLLIEFRVDQTKTSKTFQSSNGLNDFVEYLNKSFKTISPIVQFKNDQFQIPINVAFQYTNEINDLIVSFANSVKTVEGGSHVNGFKLGLLTAFNNFAFNNKLLKDKDVPLDQDDISEGLTAVISVNVPEKLINYEGQTKNKLITKEASEITKKATIDNLSLWLEKNKTVAINLIKTIIHNRDIKISARKTRESLKKTKGKQAERILSSKLTPALSHNSMENELFLVEGDSAGGSAKLGRDKSHQAILPLKGKVINVEKSKLSDVLKNDEIGTIITCLGTGIERNFNLKKLKYNKIIIMTDADVDGSHIQVLLLTMFFRFMRPLIENGNIYLAMPPLYKISKKSNPKQFSYAWDEAELENLRQEYKNYEIQRYKGLGEMNPEQLWETTMNPKTRKLLQVKIDDIVIANEQINTLMGDDSSVRKIWIDENINFEYEE
ncbi:MAG: DNA topoisomerase IV subunit B [Ureaplasma sp.]|nr:DNA topoisomerase IV subunit B [Ureaplasma sp.]